MSYFKNFPSTFYKFGTGAPITSDFAVIFQDISTYVDVIDTIKDQTSVYTKYHIQDNERPDQLSYKLYGTPDFYWTFFFMNDNIREQGWPLSNTEIVQLVQTEFPLDVITTRANLTETFLVNTRIEGLLSGATATVDHRHLDLGQLVLTNVTGRFIPGGVDQLREVGTGISSGIFVQSYEKEYLAAHHYEDVNGVTVDIDPLIGPGAQLTEVTYLDRHININNSLKEIKIIKKQAIYQVVEAFNEAIRS